MYNATASLQKVIDVSCIVSLFLIENDLMTTKGA